MKYLSVGHKVLVHIPEKDRSAHSSVAKYHGQEMTVANRKTIGRAGSDYVYYELVDAVSEPWGIPFSFIKEWLVQL